MPPGRLPATLLHGRVRTSTLLLSLLFVAVLALYLEVRPPPAGSADGAGGSAPAGTRPEPTSSVRATQSTSTETSTPETTSPPRSATSTSHPATTHGTAPAPTTAGATGTSAPS